MSVLVGNPEDRFSHKEAHLVFVFFIGDEVNPEIEHLLKAYGQETPEALSRVTVKELWENCLSPTMSQTIENLLPLLLLCFVFKLICSFSKSGKYRKTPKFSDTRKLCCKQPKIQTKRPNLRVFC